MEERIIEEDYSEDYIRENYSKNIVGQWDHRISNEFRVCKKEGIQVEEN